VNSSKIVKLPKFLLKKNDSSGVVSKAGLWTSGNRDIFSTAAFWIRSHFRAPVAPAVFTAPAPGSLLLSGPQVPTNTVSLSKARAEN
jgi:hypothetical protein